ncbi:ArsC family reductase [Alteromonas sp. ASW11-36]|uniref:ArsC family reductase n=1 Tax=Alteromonas arenosi TaxID=3055817 RepID=A0ABT7SYC3_9ALTE|nr:ArsC family reductase [Alteromonas sp. ASW11-36]MDM7861165.1 ArsC family reductase [Alteromonas sp. ASW11-36]
MTITLYGIKNCDTVKKARKWFEQQNIEYVFHDFRVDGIEQDWVSSTAKRIPWDTLLNKRGTTYRQLDDATKNTIDEALAIQLMAEQPTLIKRPVVLSDSVALVGFKADQYAELFAQ